MGGDLLSKTAGLPGTMAEEGDMKAPMKVPPLTGLIIAVVDGRCSMLVTFINMNSS